MDKHLVRVFELPVEFSPIELFQPKAHMIMERDWFYAESPFGTDYPDPNIDPERWEQAIRPYLADKGYVAPGRTYLVLHPARSFVFEGPPDA